MLNSRGDFMADASSGSSGAAAGTAVLVMNSGSMPLLCPFFGKCDGVLLIDAADDSRKFYPGDRASAKSMCDLILEIKPAQIICGFIDDAEKEKLRASGIDVRLGSCNCSVNELVASFSSLPKA